MSETDCYVCQRTRVTLPYRSIDKLEYKKYFDKKTM